MRVHEQFDVLEINDAWLNVRIDSGLGAVPEPDEPELWAGDVPRVIVNLAGGDGIRISPEALGTGSTKLGRFDEAGPVRRRGGR